MIEQKEKEESLIKLVQELLKRSEESENEILALQSAIDELEKARIRTFKLPESWALDEEI